jgi:hypothetical protein
MQLEVCYGVSVSRKAERKKKKNMQARKEQESKQKIIITHRTWEQLLPPT